MTTAAVRFRSGISTMLNQMVERFGPLIVIEYEGTVLKENTEIHVPNGFSFAGVASGVKASGSMDLALIVAESRCHTFGVFTQNRVRASSVDWNETRVGAGRAIVINSGNANACTGEEGCKDTEAMASQVAQSISSSADEVYVMSTGIIGEKLPMQKIQTGIESAFQSLQKDEDAARNAATAMMTTDQYSKIVSREFNVGGQTYRLLGFAKGAGMIAPNMATMLAVLTTDYPLESTSENKRRFKEVMDNSFNSISVDGHTSTSDQVILLANASTEKLDADSDAEFFKFLTEVSTELAKLIPADGEGATHLIEIEVRGPQSQSELKTVAQTIASSPLVKTAVFGADPNWGRIVSAAGYSGIEFDAADVTLRVNDTLLFQSGTPVDFDAASVSQSIKETFETTIQLDLGSPDQSARFWTSDLTYDYVKINAEYHT